MDAMLNGRAQEPVVTLERFYEIACQGRRTDIEAFLMRFPASARIRDPIAIAARGMKSATSGDVAGGVALLKRATSHAEPDARPYIIDLLTPLMLISNEVDEALALMDSAVDVPAELIPAFQAQRSVIAARQGQDALSAELAQDALELGRALDNPLIVGRLIQRSGLAAFYREDFDEAQERALEAARCFERIESHRNAAMAYSILYVIAHYWLADPDVTRFYARHLTMCAHLAGDQSLEHIGLLYQLEAAAAAGDSRRFGSIRGRMLANRMNEQFWHQRYTYSVAEALAHGWAGRFDIARTLLVAQRKVETLTLAERAFCDALLAAVAVASWQIDEARTLARRVISQTTERSTKEPLFETRQRRIARILAATICVIIGDATRGRRALSRAFDPDAQFATLMTSKGLDEERVPPLMVGYVRFVNEACRSAMLTRPRHGLTETELEILRVLPEGVTLATIATSFGKSKKTLEKQVGSIYSKLQVGSRAEAVRRARDLGIYA